MIKELGLYADADKDKDYKKLERLTDWMIWSNIIVEEEGQISLRKENQVVLDNQKLHEHVIENKISSRINDIAVQEKLIGQNEEILLNCIRFNIKITPETSIDEIRKIIKKVKKAIKEEKVNK